MSSYFAICYRLASRQNEFVKAIVDARLNSRPKLVYDIYNDIDVCLKMTVDVVDDTEVCRRQMSLIDM